MITKKTIESFKGEYCEIILSNGFTYRGVLKELIGSVVFLNDRFDGLKTFDRSIIKSIGMVNEDDRMG